jgi:peptidoglycan glycosyltransferase
VKGVHDHPLDDVHGNIEFLRALAVSCNVWFGQLGLQLGPDAFKKLVKDGVEMGFPGWYDPGKKGSRDLALTAFGQHASMMSVGMAARMVATIAGGGVYRKCPSSMELHAACEEKKIVEDPSVLSPVLAGMEQVMLAGTGRGLTAQLPPGIHVYGKTGTADSIGIKEELPWKVDFGVYGRPHGWFVAVAEPQANGVACQPVAPRRLAFAVVAPRSGLGARFAGPPAMELIKAAHELGYFGSAEQPQAVAAATSVPASPAAAPVAPANGATPPPQRPTGTQ